MCAAAGWTRAGFMRRRARGEEVQEVVSMDLVVAANLQ